MKLPIPLFFTFLLATFGCSKVLYVPNAPNTPLLKQKNDYAIKLAMRPIAPINLDFQSSYAPLNHFALMLNGSSLGHSPSENSLTRPIKHRFAETGAGVFFTFGENNAGEKLGRVELFGGYGLGRTKYGQGFDESNGKYQRKYLQAAVGLKTPYTEISYGVRFAEVNFSQFNDYNNGRLTNTGIYNFTTAEHVLRGAGGTEGFKIGLEIGAIAPIGRIPDYKAVSAADWVKYGIFGSFCFNKVERKEPPKPPVSLRNPNTSNTEDVRFSLQIYRPNIWFCVKQFGKKDKDFISLYFNGSMIKDSLQLSKGYICFRLEAQVGQDNLLQIQGIHSGDHPENQIQCLIKDGKVEHQFNLNVQTGKAEDIYLRL